MPLNMRGFKKGRRGGNKKVIIRPYGGAMRYTLTVVYTTQQTH